jgi:hypothetical protein
MPDLTLDLGDAGELAELLQFLRDWLSADVEHLNESLARFVRGPGYTLNELRSDLDRFSFLLRGNDGEPLFEPEPR